MNQAVKNAPTILQANTRRPRLMGLSSGPTAATPPAAAAFDVPTAGVPTWRGGSAVGATGAAAGAGRAGAGAAGRAAGAAEGAGEAASAGSPSRAVTSESVRAGKFFRLRRACSAATADLLHFLPSAIHFFTSSLIGPLGAAAGTGAGVAARAGVAGAALSTGSPRSADASASLNGGRFFLLRRACSAATADLLHFLPSATHFATSSLIVPPLAGGAAVATGAALTTGAAGTGLTALGTATTPDPPSSHDMGMPAFKAWTSAWLMGGKPFRLR